MKHHLLALLGAFLLSACNFQPGAYTANDVVLYGIKERHTFFYGKLDSSQTKALTLGPLSITLSGEQPIGPLAVPGALSVNGKPTLQTNTASYREVLAVATIPVSSELSVLTRAALERVYYFDGAKWFDVGGTAPLEANVKLRLPIRERNGLRGVGLLTDAEADAVSAYLTSTYKREPMALALINNANHADTPLGLSPRPDRNNITALYVQIGVPTDLFGGFAATPPQLRLTALSAGVNSTYDSAGPAVRLDNDSSSFAQTWALLTGNQIPQSAAPNVDFSTSRVVTFFQGRKSTGGYGVAVAGAILEGTTLSLRLTVREPAAGAVTSQALTSPYVSVVVSDAGRIERVVAVNAANGQELARTP
jgi:hypothetical protein